MSEAINELSLERMREDYRRAANEYNVNKLHACALILEAIAKATRKATDSVVLESGACYAKKVKRLTEALVMLQSSPSL